MARNVKDEDNYWRARHLHYHWSQCYQFRVPTQKDAGQLKHERKRETEFENPQRRAVHHAFVVHTRCLGCVDTQLIIVTDPNARALLQGSSSFVITKAEIDGMPSKKDKSANQQYLTPCEEKALAEYRLQSARNGYPISVKSLRLPAQARRRQQSSRPNPAIECISANGRVISPLVTWAALTQSSWTTHPTPEWHFACSESGRTNEAMILYWIQHVFDPCTSNRANGRPRVLINDGFGTHEPEEILKFCFENNIIPCHFPSHMQSSSGIHLHCNSRGSLPP